MPTKPAADHRVEVAELYFQYIRELRTGVEGAVDRLMDLWDDEGVFEFAGAPPVTGTFTGGIAIRTMYKNRFNSSGMRFALESAAPGLAIAPGGVREAVLGVVDTEINKTRALKDRVVVGWTTFIGTGDGRGFQVPGSHTFTFKDGKIRRLKVVVTPAPAPAPNLLLEGLTVTDIGRLALAAWPVV